MIWIVEFCYTALFNRSFRKLCPSARATIKKALRKLAKNPRSPYPKGMRVHKLKGVTGTPSSPGMPAPPVWEMHASMPLIITFQVECHDIILRNCGQHDDVLRSP